MLGLVSGYLVLRVVARRVASACRIEDVAGRWGGEEFLVVAPFTEGDAAFALGERIREATAAETIPVEGFEPVAATVSVGVASGSDDIDGVLRQADAALYEAKNEGRNRVVSAQPV